MPWDDPEPDDPTMLVGVELPADEGDIVEMAVAFADEFAALGCSETKLLALFHQPFYDGAHRALKVLGEETIRQIVSESVAFWKNFRVSIRDTSDEGALVQIEEDPCRQ